MLNIERHENLLKKVTENLAVMDGKPWNCNEIDCQDCDFSKNMEPCEENCEKSAKEWLLSEFKIDWSKVKVDTPILVKNTEAEEWQKRHFARFKNGKVYAWYDGLTSWSTAGEDHVNFWKYAKLAESEETVWQRSELQKN